MVTLTLILVAVTCLISYQAFNNQAMRDKFLMRPASVHEFGQWYRFITSGFLHANWMHLGINMYVLYAFGEGLELIFLQTFGDLMGRIFYLFVYLGAIVVGSIPLYLKHYDNQYYSALGASGGVAGVLFALIIIRPWADLQFIFLPFIDIPFIVFGVGYLVYESYQSKKGTGNVAHDAHIGGAIFGLVSVLVITALARPELLSYYFNNLISPPFLK